MTMWIYRTGTRPFSLHRLYCIFIIIFLCLCMINGLLTASLQVRRDQACEGQRLVLKCPAHTQLVIESAFFGRSVPYNQLCPPQREESTVTTHSSSSLPTPVQSAWEDRYEDISCDVSNAQSKVMEICQYRRKCKINSNARFFGRDPCPMTYKYLQVSYKCRPSRFGSECFSQGASMQLGCKEKQRLAVYAAIYGRTVATNPADCLAGDPIVSSDCTTDALHKIMQSCHAQSKCSILVDDSVLGSPGCANGIKKYLNVIFICVREEVFSDSALTGQLGSDESYESIGGSQLDDQNHLLPTTQSTQNDASSDFESVQRPRSFIPPLDDPSAQQGSNHTTQPLGAASPSSTVPARCLPESVPNAVIQVQNWLSTYEYIRENQEKFFLYFGLSASTGIIALLLFCIVQLFWRHRGRSTEDKNEMNTKYSASRTSSKIEVASAHSPSGFDEGRVEMTDLGRDGLSFLRFNHPTPPRNPNKNLSTTPAVSIAAAPIVHSHEFYS